MLNNVKDIIFKNKYAILVLLILSLGLRLARGYNILLSYVILIVLYIVLGIGVQIVLERFFPNFIENEKNEENKKEQVVKPVPRERSFERREEVSNRANFNANRENKIRQAGIGRENIRQSNTDSNEKIAARREIRKNESSPYEREIPRRSESNISGKVKTEPSYTRIERPSPVKPMPELKKTSPAPKVTSSYIRNAGGMSYDMEKKLVKTSADFSEIRRESDHYSNVERQRERLYNASRSAIVGKNRDLYTNTKETQAEVEVKEEFQTETQADKIVERTSSFEKISPTFTSNEENETDYTPVDYAKESEELKNEVEKRIAGSSHTTRRPIKVLEYDDTSFTGYSEPVKRQSIHIPKEEITPTTSNINKNIVLGKQPDEKPVSTRKVHVATIETSDKVDADIDKINKLFDKDGSDEPKKGLFSRFKKKRR